MQEIVLDKQEIVHDRDGKMLKAADKPATGFSNGLECKQCHGAVSNEETVAYHLVDQILYGWCQSCFGSRHTVSDTPLGALPS